MSRGKHPGRVKWKLSEVLCKTTGALFSPYDLENSHPMHIRYNGCCVWDAWGARPASETSGATKIHVYSWDTMTDCARYGFDMLPHRDVNDYELVAKKP